MEGEIRTLVRGRGEVGHRWEKTYGQRMNSGNWVIYRLTNEPKAVWCGMV